MRILIAESSRSVATELEAMINLKGHVVDICHTGKQCQLKLYQGSYDILVLDLGIQEHGATEVIRYVMSNCKELDVALIGGPDEGKHLADELREKHFVVEVCPRPVTEEVVSQKILHDRFSTWKLHQGKVATNDYEEEELLEDGFSAIPLADFVPGKINPVDFYLRLSPTKFLRILAAGDFFDQGRLDNFINEKKLTDLYVKKEQRGIYINFMNDRLRTGVDLTPAQRGRAVSALSKKYLEEVYTYGLTHEVTQESVSLCENVFQAVSQEAELHKMLMTIREEDDSEFQRLFKIAFFSVVIAKQLDWVTPRTISYVAMGGFLHDIGLAKLPTELRKLAADAKPADVAKHMAHATLGASFLETFPLIPEPVIQIVYQHHERGDGSGYPGHLQLNKIFPLAKIVGLASDFYALSVSRRFTPMECLQEFVPMYGATQRFDPLVMRALIVSFMKSKSVAS